MLLLTLLLCAATAQGQTQLIRYVFGSGATASANSQFLMAGTIGQTIIGPAQSADHRGAFGFWYTLPRPLTGVREEYTSDVSSGAALQLMPNPVTDEAVIRVTLKAASTVTLKLYDALGRQRQTLIDGRREAGTVTLRIDAAEFESGNYTLVLTANGVQRAETMRIIK
jgi:hypothetical protein